MQECHVTLSPGPTPPPCSLYVLLIYVRPPQARAQGGGQWGHKPPLSLLRAGGNKSVFSKGSDTGYLRYDYVLHGLCRKHLIKVEERVKKWKQSHRT